MTIAAIIDPAFLARELELPVDQVQSTLQLLDDGNTIPFITRYRKERTGGLNEEQILLIQQEALKLRLLAERKQTILRSIESQGILTPELTAKINAARTLKWLEDVYLPFKPKKQNLATTARQRGLEPLAKEILESNPAANDLQARGAAFVAPDRGLHSVDEVLQGVGHILAESFGERADVRGRLRKALRRDGVLTCTRVDPAERSPNTQAEPARTEESQPATPAQILPELAQISESAKSAEPVASGEPATMPEPGRTGDRRSEAPDGLSPADAEGQASLPSSAPVPFAGPADPIAVDSAEAEPGTGGNTAIDAGTSASVVVVDGSPATDMSQLPAAPPKAPGPLAAQLTAKKSAIRKQKAKERKAKLLERSFKDYYQYREALSRVPPHRILAINRGERAKVLRVRFEYEAAGLIDEATRHMVPEGHVHREFLRACARDALQRLVLPSLERELRRELAEEAEQHALQVFIRNLRKLLLQPPVRGKRILAVDPGFRSGCKLAAIDAFGNVLELGSMHLIGSDEQRNQARETLASFIRRHQLELVAIGNGAGCRAAEQIVSDVIGSEFGGSAVAYLIVNEAGASVYSTSQVGRDELPNCDPMLRSAVSIARRLQDPLSELVKINPANIGVGMYQHDMKGKNLRDSLDSVVKLCVNFVGVELNSASPSLLGYVSGLNQLTARRVYEYRQQHGPFRNREQIKEVPGIGEATFVQAAGFLRISDGDNPLDATWIHPESYDIARQVLERLNIPLADLAPRKPAESSVKGEIPGKIPVPEGPATVGIPQASDNPTSPGGSVPAEPCVADAAGRTSGGVVASAGDSSAATDIEVPIIDGPVTEVPVIEVPVIEVPVIEVPVIEVPVLDSEPKSSSTPAEESAAVAASRAPDYSAPQLASVHSLAERLSHIAIDEMSRELGIGEVLLRDILAALAKPGCDPRDDFSPPPFRTGIMKLEDLKPGMELQGTVLNVVDFGAFVDIGISDSALIHISKLADQFIRDPQEVVGVGDFLKVWVIDVDKARRRVSLTAIDPAAARRPRERRDNRPKQFKPARQATANAPASGAPPAPKAVSVNQRQQQQQRPPRKNTPPKTAGRYTAPPPKPKPVRPITSAMLTGQQPMRSFSDLMQFYNKKQDDNEKK